MTIDQALKTLNLAANSNAQEQRAAWKSAVKRHHPDKGGDAEMFRLINTAYETLKGLSSESSSHNECRPNHSNILVHRNILYSAFATTDLQVEHLTRRWMNRARNANVLRCFLGLPYKSIPTPPKSWIHILEGVSLDEDNNINYHIQTKPMPGLNIISLPNVRKKPDGSRTVLHSECEGPSSRINMSEAEAIHLKTQGMKMPHNTRPLIWFGEKAPPPLIMTQRLGYGVFKNSPFLDEHQTFLRHAKEGRSPKKIQPALTVAHFFLSFFWLVLSKAFSFAKRGTKSTLRTSKAFLKHCQRLKRRLNKRSQ